ncbi:MAG: SHOCT domain-containing protein [bacterium]|nr:SHOCT domain-containing protein [bacterium]
MMGWGNQGYGMMGGGGYGGYGGIVMILFWLLIIVGAVFVIRYFAAGHRFPGGQGGGQAPPRDPLEILRERYAMGEMSTEEFEERKKVLESGP